MGLNDVRVTYKAGGLGKLKAALKNVHLEPELQEAFKQWSNYYRAFLRDRYVKYSRGGGDWKALSPATIAARRRGRGGKNKNKRNPLVALKSKLAAIEASRAKLLGKTKPSIKKPKKAKKAAKAKPAKKAKTPVRKPKRAQHKTRTSAQIAAQLKREREAFNKRQQAEAKRQRSNEKANAREQAKRVRQREQSKRLDEREAKLRKQLRKAEAEHEYKKHGIGVAILRDTDAMFAAFMPEIQEFTGISNAADKIGLRVYFGGHSGGNFAKVKGSRITLDDLMEIHHKGLGNVPARKLVVGPNEQLANRMARRMESAMQKVLNKPA